MVDAGIVPASEQTRPALKQQNFTECKENIRRKAFVEADFGICLIPPFPNTFVGKALSTTRLMAISIRYDNCLSIVYIRG